MDSCNVNIINKIEFHGVRNTYPGGELASCYFTVPSTYRPEVGDWIGIYPVGWSSVGHYVAKRTVKPENVWSTPSGQQYGKVDFDGELLPKAAEQYYQFVYVKNGEYVRGASTPFMFGGEISQEINTIFGGKQQQQQQKEQQLQQEWLQQQLQQQQQPRNLEQVEREMQKLQNGIFGLEQGLVGYKTVFPLIEEATTIEQQLTKPYGQEWNKWNAQPAGTTLGEMLEQQLQYQQQPQQPIQARKHWQSRVAEVQQMLVESLRVEQAARRIEQQAVLGQLKSCERHIQAVQKHEQAIREHLRAKAAVKVAEFEQKVYQIVKQQQQQPEYLQQQPQQPEHYVRKYEQLLKEKVELEVAKRAAVMHKMRQTVRECERKLREIQIGEQQHFARFQQQLKAKIAGVQQPCGPAEHEARETLKQLVKEFTHEQRKEQHNLAKAQKQIACVCAEICERLDEVKSVEIYGKLRVPTIQQLVNGGKYAFEQQQHVAHVQQLEQQLAELKATLRGAKKAEKYEKYEQYEEQQPLTAAWTKKVAQKLRELEWTLRQEKEQQQLINGTEMPAVRALWYERRIQNIVQHIAQLEKQQQQPEQYFEESPVRMVAQLRDLEAELVECVQYKPAHKQQQIVAELCQQLQRVVREKLAEKLVEKSIEKQLQQESAVECFVQSGNHAAWKQVAQLERKLVQLKGMLVEKKQHQELKQRLGELEQQLTSATVGAGYSGKVHQQIRAVRQMLEQHNQQQQLQWAIQGQQQQQPQQQQLHYLFAQPEQFIQHQQKYERICQLVADLECQVIEQQQQCPRGYPTTYGQQQKYEQCPRGYPTIYGQQQQQQPKWEQQGQKSGLALVQQRFERLVQEFQQRVGGQQVQMPEWALQKVETIVQFVRQQQQEQTKLANKPYFGQQLREKIAEFEAILSIEQEQYNGQQEQPEKKQLIREVCRQARNLKQQTQAILDEWVLVSCQQNGEPQFEGDFNNNTTGITGGEYEKITEQTVLPEITLADLLSVRQPINERRNNIETLEATIFEQQKEQRQAERQIERQIERQTERQTEQQLLAEYYSMASLQQQQLQQPRVVNVESLIGELELELVKLRLQKECGPINGFYGQQPQQQPRETTTVTRVQMIGQNPETSVCDEITKIVGQTNSLLVPSLVAKVQQQQQQELGNGKTQQTNTQTVYNVEPATPFGTTTVKVQQRETTQQF